MTYVSRDPFARTELHKQSVSVNSRTCDWCGSVRRRKNGAAYLYIYCTETDGGRSHAHRGAFCCKSCHDTYNS